jgi:hypothetical protein
MDGEVNRYRQQESAKTARADTARTEVIISCHPS